MTTETTETIPQFLTETDATILRAAHAVIKRIGTDANKASWSATGDHPYYLGRLSEAAYIAGYAVRNVLTCAEVYCDQAAASPQTETEA